MSHELIAILMFSSMMLMLMTGQRVFGAIGAVAAIAALTLWGTGGSDLPFTSAMKLMKWYPLLTLPMFIFMGYVLSESRIADDLYQMFHVWMGGINGGLAIGTIGLMVLVSAMNGLSVAGMAIGATIALPELLRRGYDKRMVTGVIQAGSSLGILVPPSVVLVLYAMIARQPVGQLWLAGVIPGLVMAALFIAYIAIRCALQPNLGPALDKSERNVPLGEKLRLLRAGLLPIAIFAAMMLPFVNGWTSLVESSAIGALTALLAAILKGRMTRIVFENSVRNTLGISCMFMWIILAALCFGAVFDGLGAVKAIESLFTEQLGLSPWTILILMQLSFLVMGTFLDDTAMLVIVAPLYVPLVGALGFDLVWYGVLYTITSQIAYMTPPFGYNLFLMRAMAPPEVTLKDIYASILPFVVVMILALALVMWFPQMALWLPETVYQQHPTTEHDMSSRRKFLSNAGIGLAGAALAAPAVHTQAKTTIKWRMQTYAGAALAEHVIKPAIDDFNKVAGSDMQIELFYADQLVPTGELFRAMQKGTIDAVQSDDDSMASPTEVAVFGGYFPFASRYSLDVPVLFNQYGLNEIWDAEYAKVGVKHLSAGAWDPCHFATKDPIRSLADLKGKRVFTFPTAGRFLSQFGVVPVTLPWEDIEVAMQTGELDGVAWSGITEDYTVGWADVTNYFLTNNISGAWAGSFFANMEQYNKLPEKLRTLLKLTMDSSHYYRQWWYWGGEAALRVKGTKMQLTSIPDEEWAKVEAAAVKFWDEIASESPTKKKVVDIFKQYNADMLKAGRPYRYS